MNRSGWLSLLQVFLLLLISGLLLFAGLLLAGQGAGPGRDALISAALEDMGMAVPDEFPPDGQPSASRDLRVDTLLNLSNGGQLRSIRGPVGLGQIHLLVEYDSRGSYVQHRIVELTKPLGGWDRGNFFAASQLSGVNPFDDSGEWNTRLRPYLRRIAELIQHASETEQ